MRIWNIIAIALLGCALGCNKSPEGGTPGTNATFTITLPNAKDVKQDNKESFDASITRGSDFKKDVNLSVEAPKNVEVTLNKKKIAAGEDTKFSITVAPAKDAPLGDATVKVIGTPEGGGTATSQTFTVKVVAK